MAYGDLKVNNLIYDTGSGDATRSIVSIPLTASPTFTGTVTVPTPTAGDNSTKAATTAFVTTSFATKASPTFTGTPAAPTASANTNTTQIATTAFVMTEVGDYAPLSGATFTGTVNGTSLILSADLTVNGTTTTINTTNLDVEDKNITLGKVSSPSDTTADGGGITLKGASDKTFNWVDATDAWTSSEHIHLGDNKKLIAGTGSDIQIFHNGTKNWIEGHNGDIGIALNSGNENSANFVTNGGVLLYYDDVKKFETTTDGVTVTGTVTDTKGELRKIPKNTKASAYVAVASDAGQVVYISSGGVTINNSVFSAGDAVTIVNNSTSDQTITQGSGFTIHNTADATSGNRTLAGRGMATLWFSEVSECYISGAGLT